MTPQRPIELLWAWLCRQAAALYAWVRQRFVALTDSALDAAMARLGEAMTWEEVRRIAQVKIEEEKRIVREAHEAMRRGDAVRKELAAMVAEGLVKRVDAEVMAMGGKP